MGRERDPRRDEAKKLYKEAKGEIALNDIASQLGVPEGTVRGWKAKDKWDQSLKGEQVTERSNKTNGTERKNERSAPNNTERSKPDIEEDSDVGEDGLTPKQRLFIREYLIDLNATQAAIRAGYSKKNADRIGWQLVNNSRVSDAIEEAKRHREKRIELSMDRVVEQLAKIAFADIKSIVTWTSEGKISIRSSDEVDGTILSEISETATDSGFTTKIKLSDRMRALTKLYDHMSDETKLKLDKMAAELEKLKRENSGTGDGEDELIDDWVTAVMDDDEQDNP